MNLIKIENINGVLVTTSNRVAEELGVLHKDLLEKIDGYVKKFSSAESSAQFYIPSNYKDRSGKSNRNYFITEKGVAQLIGGYSSAVEVAFDLNVAYINKFEEMKKELNNQFKLPKTYLEAVKELAVVLEEKEAVEKLAIEQKRTIDTLVHTNKLYTTTEIAKELNLKSANELNKMLSDMKIQFKQNGTWILYSNYSNLGLVSIKQNILENGKIVYDRKWTIEGRKFILDLFTSKSISA